MKECYGNYMQYPICKGHSSCTEKGCFAKTNKDMGDCDCKYKEDCHLSRQMLQTQFRKEEKSTVQDCDFYKMIEEKCIKQYGY